MAPLVCYVVTSLENRAREELALRDIERLQAAGVFDADATGEGCDTRGCVLVAAQPMAAAEELVAQLDASVPAHIFDPRLHLSFAEHVMLALSKRYALFARIFAKKLKPVLAREARALLNRAREDLGVNGLHGADSEGAIDSAADAGADADVDAGAAAVAPEFARIVFLEAHNEYLTHVFSAAGLPVEVLVHEGLPDELGAVRQAQRLLGFTAARICGVSLEDAHLSEEACASALNDAIDATLLGRRAWLDDAGFHFSGTIALKAADGFGVPESLRLETSGGIVLFETDPGSWEAPATATRFTSTLPFVFTLDAGRAESLPLGTKIFLRYTVGGMGGCSGIRYCRRDFGKRGTGRVGKVLVDEKNGLTCFLVQSGANFCQLISRKADLADMPATRRIIRLAWIVSKLQPVRRKIVLWEKFCSRYEESARRVYERLVDEGDNRARFVLDGQVLDREIRAGRIDPAYQGQIAKRCSFAHYHLVFSAKTFIGTETLSHLIGMHSSSRLVRRHAENAHFNYVFLQHGVMYMITLGSAGRNFFSSTSSKGIRRVVVSSNLEKEHFVQSGGYAPEQLYVCGLPKYDANTWDADADLIAVMPTWRPWELASARENFAETSYYRFIEGIYEAIPAHLRPNLRILVHPRFKACVRYSDSPLAPYIVDDTPYDEILQRVKLLITDYSSISFDAFYRGANVIFDWAELDECMQAYGQGTHLMLTDELAFGEVYRGEGGQDALRALVERAYASGQSDEHLRRYRQIVSFHDGKNTERLMGLMRADRLV